MVQTKKSSTMERWDELSHDTEESIIPSLLSRKHKLPNKPLSFDKDYPEPDWYPHTWRPVNGLISEYCHHFLQQIPRCQVVYTTS